MQVHKWNLQFPSAEVFAELLAVRVTWMQITLLPRNCCFYTSASLLVCITPFSFSLIITVWTAVQTMLTVTFNSHRNRQISTPPPQNQYPWTDRQQIQHSWLRPRGEPLYQIWYKSIHWGLLGKQVKCNKKYFLFIYLPVYLFLRLTNRVWYMMGF